jgi:hypothetical protein
VQHGQMQAEADTYIGLLLGTKHTAMLATQLNRPNSNSHVVSWSTKKVKECMRHALQGPLSTMVARAHCGSSRLATSTSCMACSLRRLQQRACPTMQISMTGASLRCGAMECNAVHVQCGAKAVSQGVIVCCKWQKYCFEGTSWVD